ncbi:MAG: hypothetical protein ACRDR6_26915 [Pseudonocardiaceae bacterium]
MSNVFGIVFLALLALVVLALLFSALHRRRVRARVNALYNAASQDDDDQIQKELDRRIPIDQQDDKGNTALHFAYYDGREHAVARLVAFGADENLRNREGLTAPEMMALASAEELLERGARCLGTMGAWRDVNQGRAVYDELRGCSARIYNPAIVRLVSRNSGSRRQLLHLAIKLGISGSEEKLIEVLDGLATKEMAVDYLNAGSGSLRTAAERWTRRNNYRIYYTGGRHAVTWGKF